MVCRMNCECKNCDYFFNDEEILLIDDSNFLNEKRLVLKAVKCGKNGRYSLSYDNLKNAEFDNGMIYCCDNELAQEIMDKVKPY